MKYTKIPANTFQQIQLNAGILTTSFNPASGEIGAIVGATSGGVNFTAAPTYKDFGEDIDNCPKNTKQLKKLDDVEVKVAGTFVSATAISAKMLVGAADVDSNDATHVVPRRDIESGDFNTLWWVGDYSDVNTGDSAGFLAIKMSNALSTGGFAIQSTDKDKGKFAFEFMAHYDMNDPDTVPYEIYVKGSSALAPSILLNTHLETITVNQEITLSADVVPAGTTITWSSSASGKASVTSGGVVKGLEAGSTTITASITVDSVAYTDTCTIIVEAAS